MDKHPVISFLQIFIEGTFFPGFALLVKMMQKEAKPEPCFKEVHSKIEYSTEVSEGPSRLSDRNIFSGNRGLADGEDRPHTERAPNLTARSQERHSTVT